VTSRGRQLLQAQRDRLPPLDSPPEWIGEDGAKAWHDIVASVPGDVFRLPDGILLSVVARHLAAWRAGSIVKQESVRELYRAFGSFLMPMAARRRLLFPDARPSRSRQV
jgi:hypothetical protein